MNLPPGVYRYEALHTGHRIVTETRTITTDLIDGFAALAGDRYAIHMDDGAAIARGFPSRVAHGLLILSLIDGLKNTAPARVDALASLGWTWRFTRPVLADDTIYAEFTVAEARVTSARTRGLVVMDVEVFNQNAICVQSGQNTLIFDLESD